MFFFVFIFWFWVKKIAQIFFFSYGTHPYPFILKVQLFSESKIPPWSWNIKEISCGVYTSVSQKKFYNPCLPYLSLATSTCLICLFTHLSPSPTSAYLTRTPPHTNMWTTQLTKQIQTTLQTDIQWTKNHFHSQVQSQTKDQSHNIPSLYIIIQFNSLSLCNHCVFFNLCKNPQSWATELDPL